MTHPIAIPSTSLTDRITAAGPDTVTTAAFLIVWLSPLSLGSHAVDGAVLVMLIEFLLLHASIMLGALNLLNFSRTIRITVSSCLAGGYFLMIGGFAWSFEDWWPLLVFSWLLLGKLPLLFNRTDQKVGRNLEPAVKWAFLFVFYMFGIFITLAVPIPELGITQVSRSSLQLTGSGLWVDEPQRAVAFGVIYFGLSAWALWNEWPVRIARFASRSPGIR